MVPDYQSHYNAYLAQMQRNQAAGLYQYSISAGPSVSLNTQWPKPRRSIQRRWEDRVLRIAEKRWRRRWLSVQNWLWMLALIWGALISTAITLLLGSYLLKLILG